MQFGGSLLQQVVSNLQCWECKPASCCINFLQYRSMAGLTCSWCSSCQWQYWFHGHLGPWPGFDSREVSLVISMATFQIWASSWREWETLSPSSYVYWTRTYILDRRLWMLGTYTSLCKIRYYFKALTNFHRKLQAWTIGEKFVMKEILWSWVKEEEINFLQWGSLVGRLIWSCCSLHCQYSSRGHLVMHIMWVRWVWTLPYKPGEIKRWCLPTECTRWASM